jgi:hypothetical protein
MALPKLEVLVPEGRHFSPPETAPDEKRQQSAVASAAESVSAFGAQQLLAFFRGQPVSDTYSEPSNTLHTTYACREIRAEEPAIRRFICQSAYRR